MEFLRDKTGISSFKLSDSEHLFVARINAEDNVREKPFLSSRTSLSSFKLVRNIKKF